MRISNVCVYITELSNSINKISKVSHFDVQYRSIDWSYDDIWILFSLSECLCIIISFSSCQIRVFSTELNRAYGFDKIQRAIEWLTFSDFYGIFFRILYLKTRKSNPKMIKMFLLSYSKIMHNLSVCTKTEAKLFCQRNVTKCKQFVACR
jgi:hypothetical protein